MGFINRALLFFYTLFLACLSLGVLAVSLQFVPEPLLLNEYRYALSQGWRVAIGCGVFFLLSLHLLACSVASRHKDGDDSGELLVCNGKTGTVGIALDAVRDLVERVVLMISGVREVKVRVRLGQEKKTNATRLQIKLVLSIGQDVNALAVSDETRKAILQQLHITAGIQTADIQMRVENVSNAPTVKGRRVV